MIGINVLQRAGWALTGVVCAVSLTISTSGAEDRIETAALAPSALQFGDGPLPTVLSAEDSDRYQAIFALQKEGAWAEADPLIEAIQNPVLLGHVMAQRYLHPNKYRSRFDELRDWLALYNDHPQARRIYRLALRRKPRAETRPKRPVGRLWRGGPLANQDLAHGHVGSSLQLGEQNRRLKRLMENTMRNRMRRGWPSGALRVLADARQRGLVDNLEFDAWRSQIAASYYFAGVNQKALIQAERAAERSGHRIGLPNWIAGLAAWRMEQFERSAKHFLNLTKTRRVSGWNRAAGGYWAGRAFKKLGRTEDMTAAWQIAAKYPRTFYGKLARRALDLPTAYHWTVPELQPSEWHRLAEKPRIRRALAMAQIGKHRDAEIELRMLAAKTRGQDLDLMVKIARAANMPVLAMQVGFALTRRGEQPLDAMLHPVPPFSPQDGYRVDRALIYALMRQESGFDMRAKSQAGARGLMQLMPRTARMLARQKQVSGFTLARLYEPEVNIKLAQHYLEHLIGRSDVGPNLFHIAAAYNGGPGNLNKWRRKTDFRDDPLLFIESIPLTETRNFVERILTNLWTYRAQLNQPRPSLDALVADRWPTYMPMDKATDRFWVSAEIP